MHVGAVGLVVNSQTYGAVAHRTTWVRVQTRGPLPIPPTSLIVLSPNYCNNKGKRANNKL